MPDITELAADGEFLTRSGTTIDGKTAAEARTALDVPSNAEVDADLALKAPLASPALTGTPTVPTAAPGTNTTQAASTAFVGTAVDNAASGAAIVAVPATAAPSATNKTWDVLINSARFFNVQRVQVGGTQAVNDYLEWQVDLAAGTYSFVFIGGEQSNAGIVTLSVDGAAHGTTVDLYAAVAAARRQVLTGVVVPTTGRRTVRLEVTAKNASSANFFMPISGWSMTRTGA